MASKKKYCVNDPSPPLSDPLEGGSEKYILGGICALWVFGGALEIILAIPTLCVFTAPQGKSTKL